jgi:hypothetical protein
VGVNRISMYVIDCRAPRQRVAQQIEVAEFCRCTFMMTPLRTVFPLALCSMCRLGTDLCQSPCQNLRRVRDFPLLSV